MKTEFSPELSGSQSTQWVEGLGGSNITSAKYMKEEAVLIIAASTPFAFIRF
jgi:hypothetical protein